MQLMQLSGRACPAAAKKRGPLIATCNGPTDRCATGRAVSRLAPIIFAAATRRQVHQLPVARAIRPLAGRAWQAPCPAPPRPAPPRPAGPPACSPGLISQGAQLPPPSPPHPPAAPRSVPRGTDPGRPAAGWKMGLARARTEKARAHAGWRAPRRSRRRRGSRCRQVTFQV
jgi:hypothetical protein